MNKINKEKIKIEKIIKNIIKLNKFKIKKLSKN